MKDEDIIKKFRELVDNYSLFTNENHADHLPYCMQQQEVESFFLSILHQDRQEKDKELVEDIRLLFNSLYAEDDREPEYVRFSDIETLINNRNK